MAGVCAPGRAASPGHVTGSGCTRTPAGEVKATWRRKRGCSRLRRSPVLLTDLEWVGWQASRAGIPEPHRIGPPDSGQLAPRRRLNFLSLSPNIPNSSRKAPGRPGARAKELRLRGFPCRGRLVAARVDHTDRTAGSRSCEHLAPSSQRDWTPTATVSPGISGGAGKGSESLRKTRRTTPSGACLGVRRGQAARDEAQRRAPPASAALSARFVRGRAGARVPQSGERVGCLWVRQCRGVLLNKWGPGAPGSPRQPGQGERQLPGIGVRLGDTWVPHGIMNVFGRGCDVCFETGGQATGSSGEAK